MGTKILIAEDEPSLRMGLSLSLTMNGYEVIEAANGEEALRAIVNYKSDSAPIDLLICDIQMPVMTGEQLLEKLKKMGYSGEFVGDLTSRIEEKGSS